MRTIQCPAVTKKRILLWLGLWIVLLAIAFLVDQPVKQWLYDRHFHLEGARIMKGTWWARGLKAIPLTGTLVCVAAALCRMNWRRALVITACACTALLSDVIKWVAGRQRPVASDGSLTPLFDFTPFHRPPAGFAFFSGHAMLAFATAACAARYYPRWAVPAYTLATLVAAERVLELAHHVSDVVAAAGAGIACSLLCMKLLDTWASPPDALPIQKEAAR